jgi:hypothetical protein
MKKAEGEKCKKWNCGESEEWTNEGNGKGAARGGSASVQELREEKGKEVNASLLIVQKNQREEGEEKYARN